MGTYFLFLVMSVFMVNRTVIGTIASIKDIGLDSPQYPQGYKRPAEWMRKLFKIQNRVIPKFLYFEFYFPILFIALFPINCIIYFVMSSIPDVGGILAMIQMGFGFLYAAINIIGTFIYKKK